VTNLGGITVHYPSMAGKNVPLLTFERAVRRVKRKDRFGWGEAKDQKKGAKQGGGGGKGHFLRRWREGKGRGGPMALPGSFDFHEAKGKVGTRKRVENRAERKSRRKKQNERRKEGKGGFSNIPSKRGG